jgi:hypothetical protein
MAILVDPARAVRYSHDWPVAARQTRVSELPCYRPVQRLRCGTYSGTTCRSICDLVNFKLAVRIYPFCLPYNAPYNEPQLPY